MEDQKFWKITRYDKEKQRLLPDDILDVNPCSPSDIIYHHYELMGGRQPYGDTEFRCNYGLGERTYRWHAIQIKNGLWFVVAEEVPSEAELNKLKRYCVCDACLWAIMHDPWNLVPIKNTTTPCLRDGTYDQLTIEVARRRLVAADKVAELGMTEQLFTKLGEHCACQYHTLPLWRRILTTPNPYDSNCVHGALVFPSAILAAYARMQRATRTDPPIAWLDDSHIQDADGRGEVSAALGAVPPGHAACGMAGQLH